MRRDGIDVAYPQRWVDHPTVVAEGGVAWWCHRVSLGATTKDAWASFNRAGAEAVKLRARCAYHWLTPNHPVADQVANFLATHGSWDGDWRPMLDIEQSGVTIGQALEWCERVEQVSQRWTACYTGLFVAGGTIWKSTRLYNGSRPRVLAAYVTEQRLGELVAKYGGGVMPDVWQYLGDDGRCPGVGRRTPDGPVEATPCDNDMVLDWSKFDDLCGEGQV